MILTAALVLEFVRHSLTGAHCRYREYVNGVPTDTYVVRPCDGNELARVQPLQDGRRLVNGRLVRREIVHETPLQPWAIDIDVETGAVVRRLPLFFHAKEARVFDPNPVVTLNDPTLQDRNDAAGAVPAAAYRDVTLDPALHVTMVDRQAPNIPPPSLLQSWMFDRADDGFEYVNAAFHIDRNQRYLQSIGYVNARAVVPYAIEMDAHAAAGADNSFFIPSFTMNGFGILYYGDGGTDDAEDADLVVHEYGHAIQEWIAPGTYSGTFASQSRALSEGFGDYWAFSAHREQRLASGRDPYCFADWDARCWQDDASQNCGYPPGSDCLRRLDSPLTMADYDPRELAGNEHRNGTIWSSALRELHEQLGRETTDRIVIESMFDTPSNPTFAIAAERLLNADRLLYEGAHASAICAVMQKRGILTTCDPRPRGERTFFMSGERGLAIPENSSDGITSTLTIEDARLIEQLLVRVDIAHTSRGDLRIELVAPDGTIVLLQAVGSDRKRDIHVTYGLTAQSRESLDILRGRSAAGTWKLVVRDLRPLDRGTLQSWGLVMQFAGDTPLQTRPRAARMQTIPVVAHRIGIDATFTSNVFIANVSAARTTATLLFTPSGANGRSDFLALQLSIDAGQTIAFDDLLESAFASSGSGTLEVLGDVVVLSTLNGQTVPPVTATTAFNEAPLVVTPLPSETLRTNIGISETTGERVTVRAGTREFELAPFSHVQFAATSMRIEIAVIAGNGRVAAYASQLGVGESMFIPAEELPLGERVLIAPAISIEPWQTDLWISGPAIVEAIGAQQPRVSASTGVYEDVLARLFHRTITTAALRVTLAPDITGGTRTDSQFIPLQTADGPATQHLVGLESTPPFRTNIGIVSDAAAVAEVIVYDAAGKEAMRATLATPGGFTQVAVFPQLTSARASVHFVEGRGRAYASVIGSRATFVPGQ